ncbi:MAG: universal stress protein [Alphaproteobacteria bacterium]|nr:universal stress protein [Alphaproteobacteria bacterium]
MIKTILVPLTPTGLDDRSLAAASIIARAFNAHIDAVHVRLDPVEVAVNMTSDASGSAGVLVPSLIDDLERGADERAAVAREAFAAFLKREAFPDNANQNSARETASAQMHVETGQEIAWLLRYAITADLVVASRGPEEDTSMRPLLEALLMDSGRPLLVPATEAPKTDLDNIVIAWKATPQTGRAVTAAMPFLRRAERVTAVTIVEEDESIADDTDKLSRYLGWHGVHAEIERVRSGPLDPVAALMQTAQRRGANLVVLGAYGHSRLREWVFGGFTRQILGDAAISVLFAH